MAKTDFQVGIIGGGPGGSSMAAYLAKAGVTCVVFERELFPRPHVGESLVPSSTRVFKDLGFLSKMEENNFQHKFGAVWTASADSPVYKHGFEGLSHEYNVDIRFAERDQPGVDQIYTYHVDRGKFDNLLLHHAHELGAKVYEGVSVQGVDFDGADGAEIKYTIGKTECSTTVDIVVDASGRKTLVGNQLKWRIKDTVFDQYALHTWFDGYKRSTMAYKEALDNYIFVHFLPITNSWIWQIPITDTITSIGVVTQKKHFAGRRESREKFFWDCISTRPELYAGPPIPRTLCLDTSILKTTLPCPSMHRPAWVVSATLMHRSAWVVCAAPTCCTMDPYEKIAPFYDCEHADFRDDIDFYLNVLPDGPVLEVGSGTGRITEALARAGYTVCGVDPSDAMVSIARARLGRFPEVELLQASIEEIDLDARFHSAVLPLNTLWHFLDVAAQVAALHALRRALAPEAIVVVDLSNPLTMADRGARGEVRQRFHGECPDGPLTVWSTGWDDEAEQVLELDLLYDQLDAQGRIRRSNAHLELRYLYRYELELLLLHTGFRVRQLYGSYDLDPYTADSPNLIALAEKTQHP